MCKATLKEQCLFCLIALSVRIWQPENGIPLTMGRGEGSAHASSRKVGSEFYLVCYSSVE